MKEFQRESPYPMVSIEEAHRIIAAHTEPLATETVSSLTAYGRVLAEDVAAPEAIPDVPKAAMDGYVLRAADGLAERRVLAELTAGMLEGLTITPGAAARIMTGAPIPNGADAVIQVELTEEHDNMLRIQNAVSVGNNIHTVGQDIALGEKVLARGTVLGSAEIGLLATVGCTQVSVYRRPRVAVLATGDEVVEPDAPRSPGSVRDSNRYALLAAVHEAGCEGFSLGIVHDDPAAQRQAILRGLAQADVLLTSGGVSMGSRDLIKPILAELGIIYFGRIAFKPGKPTTFATIAEDRLAHADLAFAQEHALTAPRLVFGLPGYPVSSLVSFEVFVRPALRRLQGDARPERPRVRVALLDAIHPARDRPEYQRVVISWREGRLVARSTGAQGSSRLLSLRGANGLLLVPPGEHVYAVGAELEALALGPIEVEASSE
jgi:molybdopterin molybdotransferase